MSETGQPPATAGASAATGAITELLKPFKEEAKATRLAIEDRNRSQQRINQWLISFIAVTVVLVALVLWLLVKDNQRRAQSREIIRNNGVLSEQIADCTRATGLCYQQNQEKLRLALERLVTEHKAIEVCVRAGTAEPELSRCIAQRVAAATPKPVP